MTRALILFVLLASTAAHAANAVVSDKDAVVLTELVTTALSKQPQLEVVSSSDLRRQVSLEADRQAGGCDSDATSCLAEVADAMGAQLVVQGTLGTLDDVIVLNLTLFDSSRGQAVGRVALRDKTLGGLSAQIDDSVHGLLASFTPPAEGRARVLVLDITRPTESAPAAESASLPFLGGVTGVSVGVVALVVGGGAFYFASESDRRADDLALAPGAAALEYDNRDALAVTGAVAVVIGVVAAGTGVGLFFVE